MMRRLFQGNNRNIKKVLICTQSFKINFPKLFMCIVLQCALNLPMFKAYFLSIFSSDTRSNNIKDRIFQLCNVDEINCKKF